MMRGQVRKGDTRVENNNSVVVKPRVEEITNIELNPRKNNSSFFADKYTHQ